MHNNVVTMGNSIAPEQKRNMAIAGGVLLFSFIVLRLTNASAYGMNADRKPFTVGKPRRMRTVRAELRPEPAAGAVPNTDGLDHVIPTFKMMQDADRLNRVKASQDEYRQRQNRAKDGVSFLNRSFVVSKMADQW